MMMDLEDSGGGMGPETVYGTHEDSHVVMSEKVQSLAGSIYQEFERMIARYDEDVVKTLMPLLVNVLECLDAAYQANQEHDVELELLREDNEQLVTQYEREKGGRKAAEQKLLEAEDIAEVERKELSARLEALENIVRMLELKHKNSTEHASRLEEREAELKREYAKLHERYTELFKTHMDYMERTKLLLSGGQLADRAEIGRVSNRLNIGRSSGPVSFGFASLEPQDGVDSIPTSPISSEHSSPRCDISSLHSELDGMNMSSAGGANSGGGGVKMVEKAQETDAVSLEHRGTVTSPSTPGAPTTPSGGAPPITGRSQTKSEKRSGNTLYQELSFQDSEALADVDEGADITGSWVHPGEYASSVNDNFFGMGKEVENLIMENNELLATKNALNIVKDDLIVKVDELTGEQEMLREEIGALKIQRERSRTKIGDLEDEIKKLRDAASSAADNRSQDAQDEEHDVPMAQRKRFTRVEMARVLMERNQYKERFMELQEAVRWTEMIRANKNNPALDKTNKQSIWKFFSNLFGTNERSNQRLLQPNLSYHAHTHHVVPGVRALPSRLPSTEYLDTELGSERLVARRAVERREQYRQVRAHVRKDDGRLQAYGWSLPGKVGSGKGSASTGSVGAGGGSVPVPVPVYCRPLAETQPGMKIWCAAGVNLLGGHTRDGGLMVGGSVFYYDEPQTHSGPLAGDPVSEVESLDRELMATREAATLETQLSSLVWICTSTHAASAVTVVDANNPAEVLKSFPVCANHVLCIASVPGASPVDYSDTVTNMNTMNANTTTTDQHKEAEKSENNNSSNKDVENDANLGVGRVKFVEVTEEAEDENQNNQPSAEPNTETTTQAPNTNDSITTIITTAGDESINTVDEEPPSSDTAAEKPQEQQASSEEEKWSRAEKMSSVLATMWLGAQSGWLYVHSSVANWYTCLHRVKLNDAVLSIVHVNGRVVAALADGSVAIFRRDAEGQWDLNRYHIITLGSPLHSVRCLSVVGTRVWAGYRNRVHVVDPRTLHVVHTLEAHPRKESQVRQLAWLGDGVWVSIRLDSTLRLYHAYTYQHLQDVDIEPYVSKMLGTGKLGFSFVRITALLISSNRLWIGTGNGVIISVPLTEHTNMSSSFTGAIVPRALLPGTGIRISPGAISTTGGFIPYCTMAHAQLSFHGHRDVVKFFVAVPGAGGMSAASTPSSVGSVGSVGSLGVDAQAIVPVGSSPHSHTSKERKPPAMLVLSGGEGYIDFRIGDGDMEESIIEEQPAAAENADLGEGPSIEFKGDKGHLIVWQVV